MSSPSPADTAPMTLVERWRSGAEIRAESHALYRTTPSKHEQFADSLANALAAAETARAAAEERLGNLLARIHRDGGHYQEQHGTEKAAADAETVVVGLLQRAEAAEAQAARLREALEDIQRATVEGRVCDDVAWYDGITTLYDFCDLILNPSTPPSQEGDGRG